MGPKDIRNARSALGELWGLGRHLTMGELARVLRLRGNEPSTMVRDWEDARARVSGPVSIAIDLMLEPDDDQFDRAVEAAGEVDAGGGVPLREFLVARVGEAEAAAILEDLTLTLSDILRQPPTLREAIEQTQFHNRDIRHRPEATGRRTRGPG